MIEKNTNTNNTPGIVNNLNYLRTDKLSKKIHEHTESIIHLNNVLTVWENYKAGDVTKYSNFREFIENIPEVIKSEINFNEIKKLLGLDLVI